MLNTAARSSPCTGGLHASRLTSIRALTLSSSALTKASHYGQTRSFRFRAWSTYLDPEFQRQLRQRQRNVTYKYMELINRKLSWDPTSQAEDSRMVLKGRMAQCWTRHGHSYSRARHVKESIVKPSSDDALGTRPGQNIEDVERSAINALFSGRRSGTYEYDLWQSPLQNIRNYLSSQTRCKSTTASARRPPETQIDPITNRKVQSTGSKQSVSAQETQEQEPFFPDGVPPADELEKYGQVKTDDTRWADVGSSGGEAETPQYADLDKYNPVMDNKLDSHQQEDEPKYDDLEKYKPVGLKDFVENADSVPEYEDLHKYRPVMHNENADVPEAHEKYEDLDQYGPVMHREKEITSNSEDTQLPYDDLHKYGPSAFNEPDGARPLTEEEKSKNYDDLHKYGPVSYNEPFGGAPIHPEEASKEYDDLHKYGPVAYNEPFGGAPIHPEEVSKAYTDLHRYGPVTWNEPHGQPPLHPEEASKAYTDLDKYEPIGWNEPHGKPPMHPEEASKQYKDLGKYGPVAYQRGDGQLPEGIIAPIQPEDQGKHKPLDYNEPEHRRPKPDWDQVAHDEAKKYRSYRYNEPDGQPTEEIDPVSKGLRAFDAEIAAKANRRILNTHATQQERAEDLDLLRASDVRAKIPTSSGQSRRGYSTAHRQKLEADLPRYGLDWDISSKAARVSLRKSKSKAWEDVQPKPPKQPKQPKQALTGNYVRDFPEEFSRSWGPILAASQDQNSGTGECRSPQGDEVAAASFDGSSSKLEPALNRDSAFKSPARRARNQSQQDPYSTEPQGLEISYSEECAGKQTWPAYVRTYGMATDAAADVASSAQEATAASRAEGSTSSAAKGDASTPIVYKILAYDPTMQSINTAETTSVVPDSATPLTPAEVLLRLSNPTKFFPYFSPLQKEGYEIVSGSGDVLVFRKVREAEVAPKEPTATPTTPAIEKPTTYQAPKVNPIDMMGSDPVVPSAYSSSPTGYLNYDYPGAEAEDKPPPPFSSLERRNTASCDGRDSEAPRRPRKSRVKKMIVGAAWLGGISYAIGVVGEYFKTGGNDGRGPKGL